MVLKIKELTNGELELKPATVYRVINRFISYGLVKYSNDNEGKKYYHVTEVAKKILKKSINDYKY